MRIGSLPAIPAIWLLAILFPVGETYAQWSTSSLVNNPVSVLPGSRQFDPAITRDDAKGVFLAWADSRNGNLDIYTARITEAGEVVGTTNGKPFQVAVNNQAAPALRTREDGAIFVAWQDNRRIFSNREIWVQRVTADGIPLWPATPVAHQGNNQSPLGLTNQFGEFITAAVRTSVFHDVIGVQITDELGSPRFTPQRTVSNNAAGKQPDQPPAVVAALEGGVIAAWVDARQDSVIFAKGLLPSGNSWAAGEVILTELVRPESYPVAAADGQGGAIIAWFEPLGPEETDLVRVTRLDQNGQMVWQPPVLQLSSLFGHKSNLRIVEDGSHGAYLVWENVITQDAKLFADRVFNDGRTWGSAVEVAGTPGAQRNPQVSISNQGNTIIVWEDDRQGNVDLFAQMIDTTGSKMWGAGGIAVATTLGAQRNATVVEDGFGGAIIAWEDFRNGGDPDIYAQRVSKPGSLGEFRTIAVQTPQSGVDWEVGSAQTIRWEASPEIERIRIEISRDGGLNYDVLFDAIQNSIDGSGDVQYDPVEGPASEASRIRIRAVESPFILSETEVFSISPAVGPDLDIQPVTRTSAGDSIFLAASAMDISGVEEVVLNFRMGGAVRFDSTRMVTLNPTQFRGNIPAEFVTERGVEYFILGRDSIGQRSTSDTFFVTVDFESGLQTTDILSGSIQSAYRMVSAPNLLDMTLADDLFTASNFGAYDTTSWRLFEYRNGSYTERDSANAATFQFSPTKAYWLISAADHSLDFGSGESLSPRSPVEISLAPGWNQVGQPFAFSVSWSEILVASGQPTVQGPFIFSDAFVLATTLDPYQGYFVFNAEAEPVNLAIPGVEASQNSALAKVGDQQQALWSLTILAQCGGARDEFNHAGVHAEAKQKWDILDLPEPPPIGDYVSVYFPRADWRHPNDYTTDFRGEIGDGQVWGLELRTNIPNDEVALTLLGIEKLPTSLEATLVDEGLGVAMNLREANRFSFPTGKDGMSKRLKLIVGPGSYLDDQLSGTVVVPDNFVLSQNFPNPFNPSTTIRYGLPSEAKVRLHIFDLLGREVRTLIDNETQPAGFHLKTWNGKDMRGRPVANGLYLYRLSAGGFSETKKMLIVK